MKLMIIFLLLTVIVVIGTCVYLYKIKKKENRKRNTHIKKMKDIFDIRVKESIMYIEKYNCFSVILELGNIDYHMLADDEQESIENVLTQTMLALDGPIQFFSTTENIDTSKIIDEIRKNKTNKEQVNEYKEKMIKYLEDIMKRDISVVKNYAVISYVGKTENAANELNRKIGVLKSNFMKIKITCTILNDDKIYNLLFRELNKNSSVKKLNLYKEGENLYVEKA